MFHNFDKLKFANEYLFKSTGFVAKKKLKNVLFLGNFCEQKPLRNFKFLSQKNIEICRQKYV